MLMNKNVYIYCFLISKVTQLKKCDFWIVILSAKNDVIKKIWLSDYYPVYQKWTNFITNLIRHNLKKAKKEIVCNLERIFLHGKNSFAEVS